MKVNNLTQQDMAKKMGVSSAYISQVLNGNFNFTLKKLIELGLAIGKVPIIEFVDNAEFLGLKKEEPIIIPVAPAGKKNSFVATG